MFKNFIIIALAVITITSCTKPVKNQFTITGTVDTTFDGFILLQKRTDGPLITVDSMLLTTGKFNFKGTIEYPEVYYVTVPGTRSSIPFFIEPADIQFTVNTKDVNKTRIQGSKVQAEYDAYLDQLDQFNSKVRENYQMYMKAKEVGDEVKAREFDSLTNMYDEQRMEFSKNFVKKNPASWISPYIAYRNSWSYDMADLETTLNAFDTTLNHSIYTVYLQDYLKTLKRTDIGMLYVSFMEQDSTGMFFPIADLIGKGYLLLDFWASWCSPCRAENPNIVAAYAKYHDRGLNILGVSLDSSRPRWLKAIKDDKLDWYQVSDLQGWDCKAAKLYGVRSIPANFLIDTSGYIIAKNLYGEDLQAKLAEIFPEPQKTAKK